jgi:adenylate kinase
MSEAQERDRNLWLHGPSRPCKAAPDASGTPWRLILIGAPGVGKGTQAELLNRQLRACHLSTGDVFRTAGKESVCELSPAMHEAVTFMRRGELVPDNTVWAMIMERKTCLGCAGGFILDGFPRTLNQAESLQKLMREEGISLDAVVSYELPFEEIVARLGGRRTCEKCKSVYHVTERPPRQEGHCDACGGPLLQRDDDRPESVAVRLESYTRSTTPLIDFYRKQALLVQVPARGTPDDICARTLDELGSRRVAAVDYVSLHEI